MNGRIKLNISIIISNTNQIVSRIKFTLILHAVVICLNEFKN
jgi:hypothetical protein